MLFKHGFIILSNLLLIKGEFLFLLFFKILTYVTQMLICKYFRQKVPSYRHSSDVALQRCCLKVRFVAGLPVEFEEALPPHGKTGLVYLQSHFHHFQHFHNFLVIISVLTRTFTCLTMYFKHVGSTSGSLTYVLALFIAFPAISWSSSVRLLMF